MQTPVSLPDIHGLYFSDEALPDIPGPALLSSTTHESTAKGPAPVSSPPPHVPSSSKPNYDAFAALSNPASTSKTATPTPSMFQQFQQQVPNQSSVPRQAQVDPFAALVSQGSRTASPAPSSIPPKASAPSNSLLDLAPSAATPQASQAPQPAANDDDWAFSSSLPESSLPSSNTIEIQSSLVKVEFACTRQAGQPGINITAAFSNMTNEPISGLHFQLAVEKVSLTWLTVFRLV